MTLLASPPRTHHHLSLPRSFVNTPRPARPAGCQMELTRSQPALSLLSPVALEGKPSSEAKATSPRQIPFLYHSAGRECVCVRVCSSSSMSELAQRWSFIKTQMMQSVWSTPNMIKKYAVCLIEYALSELMK